MDAGVQCIEEVDAEIINIGEVDAGVQCIEEVDAEIQKSMVICSGH